MPGLLLQWGALTRLALAAASFACAPAFAGETPKWNCRPLAEAEAIVKAHDGSRFARLTETQWQFLRGVFAALPDTPESLPPGDRALISRFPDGTAAVSFADGEQSCVLIKLAEPYVAILMSVGEGEVVHAGTPL